MLSKRIKLIMVTIFVIVSQTAWGGLPQGPDASHVRQVVERVRMEARANTTQESREHIENFLRAQSGDDAVLYNNAGIILFLQYHPFEALWAFTKAVQQDFDSAQAMNNLSVLLTNMQRYNEAEQVLLYIINRWPGSSTPLLNLGRIYTDQKRLDLADQCVNLAFKADPGRPDTEKLGARIAVMRRDSQSAARHILNLEVLDPGNPELDRYKEKISQSEMISERLQRIRKVPMPLRFTELQDIEKELDVFVIKETETRYWDSLAQQINIAALPTYENFKMTPEIWQQIPPDMQATLSQLGAGLGTTQPTLAPSVSRSQYLMLADIIQAYEKSFMQKLDAIYTASDLPRLLKDEETRQKRFLEEYEKKARQDPEGAKKRWLSRAVTSLEETHPIFRETILNAREKANVLTIRYWGTAAALIAIVPDEYRTKELDSLKRTVSLSNLTYAKFIGRWYGLAKLPVLLDKEDEGIIAEQLHVAAADRERESRHLREEIEERLANAEWEAILNEPTSHAFELRDNEDPHAGFCAPGGDACIKFHFGDRTNPWTLNKIVLSSATPLLGLRAETTLDIENREFIMSQGVGYSTPGPVSVGEKHMTGIVLGGEHVVDVRYIYESSIDYSVPLPIIDIGVEVQLNEQIISLTDVAAKYF